MITNQSSPFLKQILLIGTIKNVQGTVRIISLLTSGCTESLESLGTKDAGELHEDQWRAISFSSAVQTLQLNFIKRIYYVLRSFIKK